MKKIFYVLTNDAMPGYVKVGVTDDIDRRLVDLYKTSVPLPFKCHYAVQLENAELYERGILEGFGDFRENDKREFLLVDVSRILSVVKLFGGVDVTPKEEYNVPSEEIPYIIKQTTDLLERSNKYSFNKISIPEGSELTFIKDDKIKCKVKNDSDVEYNGEVMSLSAASLKALKSLGYNWKSARGSDHWKYNGVSITVLIENNSFL